MRSGGSRRGVGKGLATAVWSTLFTMALAVTVTLPAAAQDDDVGPASVVVTTEVLGAVVSDLAGTFADPEIGQSLALAQYAAGVDVIYNAAGRTGLGIIEAAKETGKLTIGTSGDQRYLAPGNVVGNRPKRMDTAVLMLIEELENDQFAPGTRALGLAEGG